MIRYEIQTYTFCDGFVNTWTDDDENPITFETREQAQLELDMYLREEHVTDIGNYRVSP